MLGPPKRDEGREIVDRLPAPQLFDPVNRRGEALRIAPANFLVAQRREKTAEFFVWRRVLLLSGAAAWRWGRRKEAKRDET